MLLIIAITKALAVNYGEEGFVIFMHLCNMQRGLLVQVISDCLLMVFTEKLSMFETRWKLSFIFITNDLNLFFFIIVQFILDGNLKRLNLQNILHN